jgi:LysM repeat protein
MMPSMTDRELSSIDGAQACPFVAFEEDRDGRATGPDHRHRCYAEVRPAPRALAHQEAYCLTSAFPVCPTFQDWARREAAQARASQEQIQVPPFPGSEVSPAPTDRDADHRFDPDQPHRNPPRDWAAPPPWQGAPGEPNDVEEPEIEAIPPRGGGLAGSFADRVAGGPPPSRDAPVLEPAATSGHLPTPRRVVEDLEDGEELETSEPHRRGTPPRTRERDRTIDRAGPSWERPHRREAFPTIKTRMGLSGLSVPPVLLGVAAVVIAAVALFFLPALLGIGNAPGATATPNPTAAASGAAASDVPIDPTAVPGPTMQVYIVQAGDTMSRIANQFGVPLQALIDANKEAIPNPDTLQIGQEVIIPVTAPTSVPDAGASSSP